MFLAMPKRATVSSLLILAAVFFSSASFTEISMAAAVTAESLPPEADSVLERFRIYAGMRTPKAMMALFGSRVPGSFFQQPPVVLSDGVTQLIITIKIDHSDGRSPNFACSGARVVSSQLDEKGNLRLEIVPEEGVLQPTVSVLSKGVVREFPLAVAPPLPEGTDLGTAAFTTFLAGNGSNSDPPMDLNGDNIRDYKDVYIFTANYLVHQDSDPHSLSSRLKKARELTPKR